MKKKSLTCEKVIKKVISHVATSDPGDWPPVCAVFTYQPERPKAETHKCTSSKSNRIALK